MRSQKKIIDSWTNKSVGVDIICHCYNQEKTISLAIDSFLMQVTNFRINILIHDDYSNDHTREILQKYKKKYPKLITLILAKANQWSLGKKMIGITFPFAKEKYIALCDGDDMWCDAHKLQKQVDFLEKNANFIVCYTDIKIIGKKNDFLYDHEYSRLDLLKAKPILISSICFRNAISLPIDFFNCEGGPGDLFLFSLLGERGRGKKILGIKPTVYRKHKHNVFGTKEWDYRSRKKIITYRALAKYHSKRSTYLKIFFNWKIAECCLIIILCKLNINIDRLRDYWRFFKRNLKP